MRRRSDDRGFAALELVLGVGLLLFPVTILVVSLPKWSERQTMARTAAMELAEHRIRVNVVTPGWIDTPGERKFASDETIVRAGPKLPWGRLGTPAEVGRCVVLLCDPASEYITGSSLLVDGGITLPWWANRGSGVPD